MLLDSMLPVLLKHSTIFTSDNMFIGTISSYEYAHYAMLHFLRKL